MGFDDRTDSRNLTSTAMEKRMTTAEQLSRLEAALEYQVEDQDKVVEPSDEEITDVFRDFDSGPETSSDTMSHFSDSSSEEGEATQRGTGGQLELDYDARPKSTFGIDGNGELYRKDLRWYVSKTRKLVEHDAPQQKVEVEPLRFPPNLPGLFDKTEEKSPETPTSAQEIEYMTGTSLKDGSRKLEELFRKVHQPNNYTPAEALQIKRQMFKYRMHGRSGLEGIDEEPPIREDHLATAIWASAAAYLYRSERDQYHKEAEYQSGKRDEVTNELEETAELAEERELELQKQKQQLQRKNQEAESYRDAFERQRPLALQVKNAQMINWSPEIRQSVAEHIVAWINATNQLEGDPEIDPLNVDTVQLLLDSPFMTFTKLVSALTGLGYTFDADHLAEDLVQYTRPLGRVPAGILYASHHLENDENAVVQLLQQNDDLEQAMDENLLTRSLLEAQNKIEHLKEEDECLETSLAESRNAYQTLQCEHEIVVAANEELEGENTRLLKLLQEIKTWTEENTVVALNSAHLSPSRKEVSNWEKLESKREDSSESFTSSTKARAPTPVHVLPKKRRWVKRENKLKNTRRYQEDLAAAYKALGLYEEEEIVSTLR